MKEFLGRRISQVVIRLDFKTGKLNTTVDTHEVKEVISNMSMNFLSWGGSRIEPKNHITNKMPDIICVNDQISVYFLTDEKDLDDSVKKIMPLIHKRALQAYDDMAGLVRWLSCYKEVVLESKLVEKPVNYPVEVYVLINEIISNKNVSSSSEVKVLCNKLLSKWDAVRAKC